MLKKIIVCFLLIMPFYSMANTYDEEIRLVKSAEYKRYVLNQEYISGLVTELRYLMLSGKETEIVFDKCNQFKIFKIKFYDKSRKDFFNYVNNLEEFYSDDEFEALSKDIYVFYKILKNRIIILKKIRKEKY